MLRIRLPYCVMAGVRFAIVALLVAYIFFNTAISSQAASNNELEVATQCSFIIPSDFVPGNESGLFINKNYPMESSSIKYSIYENGKDKVLTNREKKALAANGSFLSVEDSINLTKDIYQSILAEAYEKAYGMDVGYKVTDFTTKDFDGFPGYKIMAEFNTESNIMVYQTVYIILSKYKTFTISYQMAEDDDCREMFDASASTINVR
ncbi:MAG: hypothetical protein IJJ64_05120 [Butyrivibrio sp.]|nr:hypothetical protein [Butyrivibrio sp.]